VGCCDLMRDASQSSGVSVSKCFPGVDECLSKMITLYVLSLPSLVQLVRCKKIRTDRERETVRPADKSEANRSWTHSSSLSQSDRLPH